MTATVNRYLKDPDMDHIDHALGRPVDPMAETWRNHFATDSDGVLATTFRQSLYWRAGRTMGDMTSFVVTDAGRMALHLHLVEIKDPHRLFEISYAGHSWTEVGTSRSSARYQAWLNISDSCSELRFVDFCRGARVRTA